MALHCNIFYCYLKMELRTYINITKTYQAFVLSAKSNTETLVMLQSEIKIVRRLMIIEAG